MKSHSKIKCFFVIHCYLLAQLIIILLQSWMVSVIDARPCSFQPNVILFSSFFFFFFWMACKHRGKSLEIHLKGAMYKYCVLPCWWWDRREGGDRKSDSLDWSCLRLSGFKITLNKCDILFNRHHSRVRFPLSEEKLWVASSIEKHWNVFSAGKANFNVEKRKNRVSWGSCPFKLKKSEQSFCVRRSQ